jgi:hypothetical protein
MDLVTVVQPQPIPHGQVKKQSTGTSTYEDQQDTSRKKTRKTPPTTTGLSTFTTQKAIRHLYPSRHVYTNIQQPSQYYGTADTGRLVGKPNIIKHHATGDRNRSGPGIKLEHEQDPR